MTYNFLTNSGNIIIILVVVITISILMFAALVPKKKPTPTIQDIGFLKENVIYFHIKLFKTKEEIAQEANVKMEELDKIFQKQMPSFETLNKLAVYFNVPRERLVYHDFRKDQEN